MADPLTIKTSTRRVNGINTRIEVNTETGAATLYQDNGIAGRTVLATASSIGNNWTVTNNFASVYSTRVGSTLTLAQAQTYFARDFQKDANNDRASIVNTWSPPNTKTYLATTAKVPGVIDPVTGLKTGQTTSPTQDPAPIPDPPAAAAPDPATGGGSVPIDPQSSGSSGLIPLAKVKDDYGTLYYPINRREEKNFDYLKVTPIKFNESGLSGDLTDFKVKSTESRSSTNLGYVFLPMQPGISDTNGVSWNEDPLNPFQAALGGIAADAIATIGGGAAATGAKNLIKNLISTGENLAKSKGMENYISAYFAGQAVGTNLVARTTGAVLNNNLELLFNGPKLRSFRYNFRFTPREESESVMIKKIIRLFKREMASSKSDTGLFLVSPSVFKLEYISSNGPHPFLNKIKTCALTDMSVNYTPDGTYMTYQDRSMTSYEVQLQFSELEPIYKEDYDSGVGTEGMGY